MSIPFAICPTCAMKRASKSGFTVGQMVECRGCKTAFPVPDPSARKKAKPPAVEDDDEEERPKKKKKKGTKAGEGSYASSPMRFVVLGVLVVTMLVMGYFLYRKFTAPPLPDIIVPAKIVPGED